MIEVGALALDALFLGRYQVVRRIAAGGMGAVYEVLDQKTNKRRALKIMLPSMLEDPDFRARFEREARITGGIESDHVIHISDAGVDDATTMPFLVMELLTGEELSRIVKRRGGLPPAEALVYLTQAARGLDKTHAAGIVHRDLKPENLFITTADDGSPRLKILDFGIAKIVAPGADKTTRAPGTPKYMAPEQMKGEPIGAYTDIYALGHIAYTLLAGEAYWVEDERESRDALFQFLSKVVAGAEEPPSVRAARRTGVSLPPAFDPWFLRCTAPDRRARFPSAGAAIASLAQALDGGVHSGYSQTTNASQGATPPRTGEDAGARTSVAAPEQGQTPSGGEGSGSSERGTTGRGWGTAVVEPPRGRGLQVGVALVSVAAIVGGAFLLFRGSSGSGAATPESASASARGDTSAVPTERPAVEPAKVAPSVTAAPSSTSAPTARSTAKSAGSASRPTPSSSASSVAAPSPSVAGVVDPWSTPTRSSKPTTPPPAATTTKKPGMF